MSDDVAVLVTCLIAITSVLVGGGLVLIGYWLGRPR